jgi:hypothetical protein
MNTRTVTSAPSQCMQALDALKRKPEGTFPEKKVILTPEDLPEVDVPQPESKPSPDSPSQDQPSPQASLSSKGSVAKSGSSQGDTGASDSASGSREESAASTPPAAAADSQAISAAFIGTQVTLAFSQAHRCLFQLHRHTGVAFNHVETGSVRLQMCLAQDCHLLVRNQTN